MTKNPPDLSNLTLLDDDPSAPKDPDLYVRAVAMAAKLKGDIKLRRLNQVMKTAAANGTPPITPEGAAVALRAFYIDYERAPRWRPLHDRAYFFIRRAGRQLRRRIYASRAFDSLIMSVAKQTPTDALQYGWRLLLWLERIPTNRSGTFGDPREVAAALRKHAADKCALLAQLRELSHKLLPQYARRLRALASEIEADSTSTRRSVLLRDEDIDPDLLGQRGGASKADGALRGWLVRELDKRLPQTHGFEVFCYIGTPDPLRNQGVKQTKGPRNRSPRTLKTLPGLASPVSFSGIRLGTVRLT
jgi:hypothetical protein